MATNAVEFLAAEPFFLWAKATPAGEGRQLRYLLLAANKLCNYVEFDSRQKNPKSLERQIIDARSVDQLVFPHYHALTVSRAVYLK